ncbi:MAG: glycosyltransferase [Bacteroidales bacterium]|nr:glycosyltransferase [Bacteroidales bacterium]
MKKNILIAIHYMELGGAEMSLLGLLESIDYSQNSVDLFVYSHRGELMKWIPKQVDLLPEMSEYKQIERPIKDVLKDGFIRIAFARLFAKAQFRKYVRHKHPADGSAIFSYVSKSLSKILPDINPEKEYDLAVSYLAPHDYVLDHVRAKEKVAWIHTDYSGIDVDVDLELPIWSGYDKIVSISPDVTRSFLKVFPTLAGKIVERPNVVPSDYVSRRSEEMSPEDVEKDMPKASGRVNLLSVGRFCHAKNYDNVPDICRRVRQKGVEAYWYLIGFGGDEGLIRQRIAEAGMDEYVRILGKKENPYPYMKACDFYVQPSRYEGSPMTILEAQALGRVVIVTDFPTAGSISGVDIVPSDNEGCAAGIAQLIGKM